MWLLHYFNFERNYVVLKLKSPCIFLNKNINFNKNETVENPAHSFRETNHVLQLIEKLQIKSKAGWWVRAHERKKRAFFVPFIFSEGKFFHTCVLSQCIVYWILFQNIHTFTYHKTLLDTLLSKAFIVSLKTFSLKTQSLPSCYCFSINICLKKNYYVE